MTTVGERLKSLRKERQLLQIEVAEELSISRSHLSKLETDNDGAGRDVLMKLAGYYDVSLDWLTTGSGDRTKRRIYSQTKDEAFLLSAFRRLPEAEAKHLLLMLRARIQSMSPMSVALEKAHMSLETPPIDA